MSRFTEAEWRPVPNFAPGGMTVLGLCPHVIVGSLAGADSVFRNTNPKQKGGRRSAHFGVGKDGHLVQWVDTKDQAWAQAAGNPFYVSAECEGLDSEPHTPAQILTLALLLAWLHDTDAVPFAVVDQPGDRGVISHRNGGAAWGGHSCPGDQRHAQRGEIVARARHLHDPTPLPPTAPVVTVFSEDSMRRIDKDLGNLDEHGNGWVRLEGVDALKVVSVVAQGSFPPDDGYWNLPTFGRQQRDGDTIIQVSEADPRFHDQLSVWVAD